ncbi:hypothetical protein BDV98DRAFT_470228, partial [Pterulicium gracile]
LIWGGDFNCHHPLWDNKANNHLFATSALDQAEHLLRITSDARLSMILPKGAPTLQHMHSKN